MKPIVNKGSVGTTGVDVFLDIAKNSELLSSTSLSTEQVDTKAPKTMLERAAIDAEKIFAKYLETTDSDYEDVVMEFLQETYNAIIGRRNFGIYDAGDGSVIALIAKAPTLTTVEKEEEATSEVKKRSVNNLADYKDVVSLTKRVEELESKLDKLPSELWHY